MKTTIEKYRILAASRGGSAQTSKGIKKFLAEHKPPRDPLCR